MQVGQLVAVCVPLGNGSAACPSQLLMTAPSPVALAADGHSQYTWAESVLLVSQTGSSVHRECDCVV